MNILDIAIAKRLAGGGGSGTDNYNDLSNLPKINDVTLGGNKTSSALGLQSEIKNDNKLSSDLVDDANKTNKFVTASEKETWNGKQNLIDNSHKLSSDLVDDTNKTNKFVTSTEKNTWNAKQNAIDADHKLSSSLVSFSEAEAAALASGINSTKVGQISTNQTNISSVEDMICATEFSPSTAYAVGDMVTYEHKLYKFINAHQGAWSASDVQNYDLTRLEAEDRASLAEVVDSGAKNIAEIYNVTENAITITTSGYKATFSGSASRDGSITWGKLHVNTTGDYVVYSNMSTSAGRFTVYNQTDSVILRSFYPVDNQTPIVLSLVAGKNYTVYSWFAAGTASACVIDLMVATKAAFGVSQKFVPYCKSNYQLTTDIGNVNAVLEAVL